MKLKELLKEELTDEEYSDFELALRDVDGIDFSLVEPYLKQRFQEMWEESPKTLRVKIKNYLIKHNVPEKTYNSLKGKKGSSVNNTLQNYPTLFGRTNKL